MDDNISTPKLIQSLYEAALQGDVVLLQELLRRDPLLLHRPLLSSNTSPLHVACKLGHTDFVLKLLHLNRTLVEELDPNDKSSILHQAARNGHLELVTSLASGYPSMCFARDMLGRNPVHVAAVKGQLHVLEKLLTLTPAAARERVGSLDGGCSGDTILHLCVKCDKLDALTLVMNMVGDAELLNSTNVDGSTILHVAVANKRREIVELLLKERRLKKNTQNSNGLTAMDVFEGSPTGLNKKDEGLGSTLRRAKVLPSSKIKKERNKDDHLNWLESQRSALMIVASLIATIAYQAGINPPGGVWQDSGSDDPSSTTSHSAAAPTKSHTAGTSILNTEDPSAYTWFLVSNVIGFVLSMSSILLLISGLPCRRFSMALIMVTMWVAVFAMTFSFIPSTSTFIPDKNWNITDDNVYSITLYVCFGLMALLLLGHIFLWTWRFIKHLWSCCISNRAQNM